MLARVRAVADFIDSYKNAMQADAEVEHLVATQVEVLKKSFAAETCDVADVSSTLRALADGGDPLILSSFSVGDRRALATAITSSVSPSAAPKATAIPKASNQTHLFLYNYLTRRDWDCIVNSQSEIEKLNTLVNRSLRIGLLNPTEKTVVAVVSLMFVASRVAAGPDESLATVDKYKSINKATRESGSYAQTFAMFPSDISEFIFAHGSSYDDDDLPIPCPVSVNDIEQRRSCMPARRTHKSLQANVAATVPNMAAINSQVIASLAGMFMQQQRKGSGCELQMLVGSPQSRGSGSRQPIADLAIADLVQGPGRGSQPQALALTDVAGHGQLGSQTRLGAGVQIGSPLRDGQDPPSAIATREDGGSEGCDVDKMVKDCLEAMNRKKASPGGDEGGGSEAGEDDGHSKKNSPKPKPGAKKGAKVVNKRPAAASVADMPKYKKPKVDMEWTRSQAMARTGKPGEGQTKAFPFKKGEHEVAKAHAMKWLKKACVENGIPF